MYVGKRIACRQNNLFKNNQSQLYKELGGSGKKADVPNPNAEEARRFWRDIWSVEKEHNEQANWLESVKDSFAGVDKQPDVVLELDDVTAGYEKCPTGKSPGC